MARTPAEPPDSAATVQGMAFLDEPLVDAEVLFFSPDGTPLATRQPVRTQDSGVFRGELVTPRGDFRVLVRKDGEAYASDYRNYDPSQWIVVTPLTNLVSAYLTSNSKTLEQASAEIRTLLGLPATFDLRDDMATIGHRGGFVARSYLTRARENQQNASLDGKSPYVVQFLQTAQSTPPPDFPDVPGAKNGVFADTQSKIWEAQSAQLAIAVITSVLQFAGVPGVPLIGWGLTFLSGQIIGDPQQAEFNALAAEIQLLAGEVDAVGKALVKEIEDATFRNSLAVTNQSVFGVISDATNRLNNSVQNGASYSERQTLSAYLTSTTFTQTLDTIHNDQMSAAGVPGLIQLCQNITGLSRGNFYGNEKQFNPIISEFSYFAALQVQAVNLIIEGFHSLEPSNPNAARLWYDRFKANLASQASALPQPLASDEIIYLHSSGQIFYRRSLPPVESPGPAEKLAGKFHLGDFKYWKVADQRDYVALLGDRLNFSVRDLNNRGFRLAPSGGGGNEYHYGTDEGYRVLLERGVDEVRKPFPYQSDVDLWFDEGPFPYMIRLDLKRTFNELSASKPELFLPIAHLNSIRVVDKAAESRVQALGTYKVNIEGEIRELKDVDITHLVGWSTSDADTLSIQNPPANNNVKRLDNTPQIRLGPGIYTWHKGGQVKVTASAIDCFDSNFTVITGTKDLSNQNVPTPTVLSVLVTPKKSTIDTAPSATNVTAIQFFSNGTSAQTSTGLNWTITDVAGREVVPSVAEVVSIGGQYQLNLHSKPAGEFLDLTATTSNGKSDQARFYLLIP